MRLQEDVKDAFKEVVELREVLTDALNLKQGWRVRARQVLGLEYELHCARCSKPFPSGGKRKRFCTDLCRELFVEKNPSA